MSEPRLNSLAGRDQITSPWWSLHEARYRFALRYVRGRKLLDLACGTGYGLPILLNAVEFVVGVDIDLQAVAHAREHVRGRNAVVICADACALPFPDNTFDAITSFETIEHLPQPLVFLAELNRVLRDD